MLKNRRFFPAVAALTAVAGFFGSVFWPIPASRLRAESTASLRIVDRNGVLLREVLSDREGRGQWVSLDAISEHAVSATLAVEDGRFYSHPGIDILSIARAAWQNLCAGRIVAGGSTLTQQVVRNLYGLRRSFPAKAYEAWLALRLERTLSKRQILEQYLNRVPYGNRTAGIEAAARLYFDKPSAHLSPAEAAFLAGLPQSPTRYNPYRAPDRAASRQRQVLRLMRDKGAISEAQHDRAVRQALVLVPPRVNFRAPHFVDYLLYRAGVDRRRAGSVRRTTLDAYLQSTVELLVRGHVKSLATEGVTHAAALVMDSATGEILAWVGSADYFDPLHDGQVNGVLALRQPGSALKPFTYGLALERGLTAATVLPDIPTFASTAGGDFTPRNYDGRFHGPVRLRTALACSYNVPAVRVLETMGAELLLHRLRAAGFSSLNKPPGHYGLGLTLGNGEVTLLELTRAYAALARGGLYLRERVLLDGDGANSGSDGARSDPLPNARISATVVGGATFPPLKKGGPRGDLPLSQLSTPPPDDAENRIFSPAVAFLLTDILSDADARSPAFGRNSPLELPFPCAVKTGTSKDFRDNWCVGFTSRYTVGVWVGNFDGRPMRRVSGVSGAGPLFRDVMLALHRDRPPEGFSPPPGLSRRPVCAVSGLRPMPHCPQRRLEWFVEDTEPQGTCTWHLVGPAGESGDPRVVTVYPPPYRTWASEQGFDLSEMPEAPVCPAQPEGEGTISGGTATWDEMTIAFPDEGDIFRIDPVLRPRYQTLKLEVVAPPAVDRVTWLVDGRAFAEARAPFAVRWPLRAGVHALQAVAYGPERLESRTVNIRVLE